MANRTKIIFLTEVHFNKRDYGRFGIEILVNNGFEVEIWDFTPFLTNKAYQNVTLADPIEWTGHFKYKNEKEVISAILGLSQSCIIFSFVRYNIQSAAIFRAISKRKIFYCEQIYAYPKIALPPMQQLARKMANFTIDKLCSRIFLTIPLKIMDVRPADLRLMNAEKSLSASERLNTESKVLWAHNWDYDLFLKTKDASLGIEKNKGVFLDQNWPFHSDFAFLGLKSPFNVQEYYGALCRFFDHLENRFGVKTVIAAHPRSKYEDMPDLFGGREVIRGKTVELVRDAGVVMAHNSVAMNFAVLFKKPLIFLTSNTINENYNKGIDEPSISWLASLLGKEAHNIDHPIHVDFNKELAIDEEAYRNFKNNYIKKDGSEELPYWQIFANYLKKEYVRNQ